LYPIAWLGNVETWFRKQLPYKLSKTGVPFHIIGSNWSVDEDKKEWDGYGFSTIYGPNGVILAGSGLYQGSDIIYCDIPTQKALPVQKSMDFEYYRNCF